MEQFVLFDAALNPMPTGATRSICVVIEDGQRCSNPVRYSQLCGAHYQRKRKYGSFKLPPKPEKKNQGLCAAPEGCTNQARTMGLCGKHYARLWSTGTTELRPRVIVYDIFAECSYRAAHTRINRLWGPAADFRCVGAGCTKMAHEWAYDQCDPTEIYGANERSKCFYSRYPEFYMPMCVRCHRDLDAKRRADELEEVRQLRIERRRLGCSAAAS